MATLADLEQQGFDVENRWPRTHLETRSLLSGEGRMLRQHELVRAIQTMGVSDLDTRPDRA